MMMVRNKEEKLSQRDIIQWSWVSGFDRIPISICLKSLWETHWRLPNFRPPKVRFETQTIKWGFEWAEIKTETQSIESGLGWAEIRKLKLFVSSLISARLKANSILLVSNLTSSGPKFENLAQAHPLRGKLPASGCVHLELSNIGWSRTVQGEIWNSNYQNKINLGRNECWELKYWIRFRLDWNPKAEIFWVIFDFSAI